jgi:hypothetical protein
MTLADFGNPPRILKTKQASNLIDVLSGSVPKAHNGRAFEVDMVFVAVAVNTPER